MLGFAGNTNSSFWGWLRGHPYFFTYFSALWFTVVAYAQKVGIEEQIQVVLQDYEGQANYEQIYERLWQYYQKGIDINKASDKNLLQFGLRKRHIDALRIHKARFGDLRNIYELRAVPYFDKKIFEQIKPFFYTKSQKNINRQVFILRWRHTLQRRVGDTAAYLGIPHAWYLRYRVQKNKLSFNITAEQDAGEPFAFNSKQYGIDFHSAYVHYKPGTVLEEIIIGDYQAQFGQGLAMAGWGWGKSYQIESVYRLNKGLLPYHSASEVGFLRGMATKWKLRQNVHTYLMYSIKDLDASVLEEDSLVRVAQISINSGLHRTENERAKRANNTQQSFISALEYNKKHIQAGVVYVFDYFQNEIFNPNPKLYQYFNFQGKRKHLASAYGAYTWRTMRLFGELAHGLEENLGFLFGTLWAVDPRLSVSVLYRDYDPKFTSLHSSAFGENTQNTNEKGLYTGIGIYLPNKMQLNAYVDYFTFPWARYQSDLPSKGQEYGLYFRHEFSKEWYWRVQARFKEVERNWKDADRKVNVLKAYHSAHYNALIHLKRAYYGLKYGLKANLQYNRYENEQGYFLESIFNIRSKHFNIYAVYAFFDNTYRTKQYTYEHDLPYLFTFSGYQGQGRRMYLLCKYKTRKTTFSLKYLRIEYMDRQSISSGLQLIEGNVQENLSAQVSVEIGK